MEEARTSWVLLVGAAVAGSTVVYGSYWYGVKEKRDSASGQHLLQDARGRLDNARRERDSLNESADVFRTLVERGLLQREQRLDLVELVNTLRSRHQLYSLDYEIAPQRTLPLAGGRVFSSIDVQASRVTLKARGLHEGDLLGFISDLSRSRQGFYPVDRCNLRRVLGARRDPAGPRGGRLHARMDHAQGQACEPPGLASRSRWRSPRVAPTGKGSARSSTRRPSASSSTASAAARR